MKILIEQFGIPLTDNCVRTARRHYGIPKSGLKGYFPKGKPSFNKGKKQSDYMTPEAIERSKPTRFQKGHPSANHKPVGSERLDSDGYMLIKVAEPNVWRSKNRFLYEQYHNVKLKKSDIVTFLDCDRFNFSKENLICISKGENIQLNKYKLYSDDGNLTKCGLDIVRLRKKIKEMKNEE